MHKIYLWAFGIFLLLAASVPASVSAAITVTSSNSYPGFPATNTLDNDEGTYWNSGGFVEQWIEYDLGVAQTLSRISFTSAQNPNGLSTFVIYAGPTPNPTTVVKNLSGYTSNGDVLGATLAPAVNNVRYVRIKVTKSPSWVAIGTVRFNNLAAPLTFKVSKDNNIQQFGYFASAMAGAGTGNYINEVAPLSNIVFISWQTTNELVSKVQQARAKGLGVVLMVQSVFFPWASSKLFADPQARFDAAWLALAPYRSSIRGFYIKDEPFLHNAIGAPAHESVPDAQLTANLNWVADYLQSVAPTVPSIIIFSYVESARPNFFTQLLPRRVDWIGFDCYYAFGANCTEAKVTAFFNNFLTKKDAAQKIVLVPDAFWKNGQYIANDQAIATRFNLYKQFALNPQVVAIYPFLYPTIPASNLYGAKSLPITKANFKNYFDWYIASLFN